jgi:hypothetical protein
MKEIARPFFPPRPDDAPPEPDYAESGVLEDIASQSGLAPERAFDVTWPFEFPDDETLTRALIAPAGLALLVGAEREPAFRRALVDGLAEYRTPDGGYRLSNQYHFLIARAPSCSGPNLRSASQAGERPSRVHTARVPASRP